MKAMRNIIESQDLKRLKYDGKEIKVHQIWVRYGKEWCVENIYRIKQVGYSSITIELYSNDGDRGELIKVSPFKLTESFSPKPESAVSDKA